MRLTTRIGAALIAAATDLAIGTTAAHAAPAAHHHHHLATGYSIAVAQIVRPDSGVAGTWATDQINRTTIITRTGPNTYHASISDEGSFQTIPGANTPNTPGVFITALGNGFRSTAALGGGRTYDITSATGPDLNAINGHVANAPSSDGWLNLAFPHGVVTANNDWHWTYSLTCRTLFGLIQSFQSWTNSAAGNSGNILGC